MQNKKLTAKDFAVGQVVYLESSDARDNRNGLRKAAISSVGREWVGLDGSRLMRFAPPSLRFELKGYGVRGTVWLSLEDYQAECVRRTAWQAVKDAVANRLGGGAPEHLNAVQMHEIAAWIRGPKGGV